MLGVQLDQLVFLVGSPLFLGDAALEVVVVPLAALLAVSACDGVLLFHDFGYFAPLLDSPFFVDFFEDFVFLTLKEMYLGLPYFSLTHLQLNSFIPMLSVYYII